MPLCKLCQSCDLVNIPRLPPTCSRYPVPIKCFLSLIQIGKRSNQADASQPREDDAPLGFPFHQSLEALRTEVGPSGCSICNVVERDVLRFEAELTAAQEADVLGSRVLKGPDWKMYIAKGVNEISGFMVVCHDVANTNCVWVVSAVGLSVDDDDPLSNLVVGRNIDEDALAARTVGRALQWVEECEAEHADTRCATSYAPLPQRVLDVESLSSDGVALYTTHGESGKYATLSHAWGTVDQETTMTADIKAHEKGLELRILPKSFQEAVAVTRKLGIRYLWIDILCMSDGDFPDCNRESTTVASIYSNAFIMLSATGSLNDAEGLPMRRTAPSYQSFNYVHQNVHGIIFASSISKQIALFPGNYDLLSDEPLSQHGWALQERYLSPRILHFGSEQLMFECYGHFATEDGYRMHGRVDTLHQDAKPDHTKQKLSGEPGGRRLWQNILQNYCRRTLPRAADKLPALSNLARTVQEQTGDTYVAGLWRSKLIEGLIWQATGHASGKTSEAPEYRAPSWSWASINGPFGTFTLGLGVDAGDWTELGTVLDCKVGLKGENPYGEVVTASLKLRVPLESLSPRLDKEPNPQGRWMKMANGAESGTYCIFDTRERKKSAEGLPMSVLVLINVKHAGYDTGSYHGVVVVPVTGQEGVYRRVGKVAFGEAELGECEWMKDDSKLSTVTLV